ncbi:hypothetical protein PO909_026370 [Leuciscus waleckii]
MANYCAHFIKNFASISAPLCELYGKPFILVTDHKALEIIWNNPRSKPPARIERWGLRLQPYNFRVEYRKGTDNPADYISHHPIPMQKSESTRAVKVAEDYVNFVAEHATPKAMTLSEIKDETLKDPILQKVSTHIIPTGEYLLVIIDEYSRYPVVEIAISVSANTVIPIIDKVFSMFGIPRVLKTDNGPPFNSEQFSKFAGHLGFHHRKITPLWLQTNATAEHFMSTLGKAIHVAETQSTPWKQRLNTFLREYRATPHSTTEVSPA